MEKPKATAKLSCPQYQKPMSQVCHKCAWWMGVGKDTDNLKWECAVAINAMAAIETTTQTAKTAKMVDELGASVQSLRNENARIHIESINAAEAQKRFVADETVRAIAVASAAKALEHQR